MEVSGSERPSAHDPSTPEISWYPCQPCSHPGHLVGRHQHWEGRLPHPQRHQSIEHSFSNAQGFRRIMLDPGKPAYMVSFELRGQAWYIWNE